MARNSKNNNPIAAAIAIIVAIPLLIINFLMENVWAIVLLVVLLVGVIAFFIIKHKMFLNYYYDKERWKSMIDAPAQFDSNLTSAIENAVLNGTTVTVGSENSAFAELRGALPEVFLSKHQIPSGIVLSCLDLKSVANTVNRPSMGNVSPLSAQFGLKIACAPMILRSTDKNNRGLVLYVFPETILAFVEGQRQSQIYV